MTKCVLRKHRMGLVPIDDEGIEFLQSIRDGQEIMVEGKPARRPRQHRLFFKMLHILVENSDRFDTIEQALTAVKIGIGEADAVIDDATGKTFWVVRSIAFESCDQARFNRIFDAALHLICARWLVGLGEDSLRTEIYRLVDGPAAIGQRVA